MPKMVKKLSDAELKDLIAITIPKVGFPDPEKSHTAAHHIVGLASICAFNAIKTLVGEAEDPDQYLRQWVNTIRKINQSYSESAEIEEAKLFINAIPKFLGFMKACVNSLTEDTSESGVDFGSKVVRTMAIRAREMLLKRDLSLPEATVNSLCNYFLEVSREDNRSRIDSAPLLVG